MISMTMNKSTEALESEHERSVMAKMAGKRKCYLLFSIFLCMAGITSLTATVAILHSRKMNCDAKQSTQNAVNCINNDKLRVLFEKIKRKSQESCLASSASFNFTPEMYRCRTQTAQALLKELKSVEASLVRDGVSISGEQCQTLELAKYFLKNTFGVPYENNYNAGDWLMTPNIFCWQKSCAVLPADISSLKNTKEVQQTIDNMRGYGEIYRQRLQNLRYGVSVGIVPAREACLAGAQTFKYIHNRVAKNGPTGILQHLNNDSVDQIDQTEKDAWLKMKKQTMMESLRQNLVKEVGQPLNDLIRYLEGDHIRHCPPSNVSSGFATLPLPYVYTDGVADHSQPTNGTLPGGEKFDGKEAYKILLYFFATSDITPKEIDNLATQRLREIYPKVLKIARNRTSESNDSRAIEQFRAILAGHQYFYTLTNETKHAEPHLVCHDAESAKKHCPERWKAMNIWRQTAQSIVSRLRPKVPSAFYLTGKKKITPICPIQVDFDYNPSSGYYSYLEGSKNCVILATVKIPFFLDKLGPRYEEVTVMAHESSPGHHLEVQGVKENFHFKCEEMGDWFSKKMYFAAFSEGWATYIEKHVTVRDMKLYENDVMSEYGMWKHQILSALRAKVDVGLHFFGMKRDEAVALYEKYALETGDVIQKEITRMQSAPGQGTAYMVGEAKLSELRQKAETTLGQTFSVRDFHYEVLGRGALPMDYLSANIDKYLAQVKTKKL